MKRDLIVAAVLAIAPIASAATNYVNSFNTVINAGDPTDAGNTFLLAGQVVTDNAGDVGILGVDDIGDSDVIYSANNLGTYSNQVVFDGASNDSPNVPGAGDSFQFDDLAISPAAVTGEPVLTFAASDGNTNAQGILQWDSLTPLVTGVTDVAFDGDSKGYTNVGGPGGTFSGGAFLEMQVNGSSQVLFPATNTNASGPAQNVILYGNSTALSAAFTSSSTLSNASYADYRVGVGADGSGLAVLNSTATGPGFYLLPSNPLNSPALINLGNSNYVPSTQYNPVVGYASSPTGPNQLAVMLVDDSPTRQAHQISENLLMSVNGGTARPIIGAEFQIGTAIATGPESFYGQLAPNGQFAAMIPNVSTGTGGFAIQYANLATLSPSSDLATIATEASASGPLENSAVAVDPVPHGTNLEIINLQETAGDWYPEVNSNGTVVFPANIGTSPADPNPNQAILLWQPGDVSPQIVLSSSSTGAITDTDVIDIAGYPAVINDFNWDGLSSDGDYYKNALSDNYVALDVDYTYLDDPSNILAGNAGDSGNAVIITPLSVSASVPEPGCLSVLGLGAFGLMRRRRQA